MNGWDDETYRKLFGSIEAPMDAGELAVRPGPREVEVSVSGSRRSDYRRAIARKIRHDRLVDWLEKRGSFQERGR